MKTQIRTATAADAAALLEIYQPYVEGTAITFELEVPTVEEFRGRIEKTLKRYPYLVLEEVSEGDEEEMANVVAPRMLGYAYAGVFKDRAAYDHCVELSIYLDEKLQGKGYGRRLYEALEAKLKEMGITNLYACIAYPQIEDEYLTRNSVKFHEHLGFEIVGTFHKCGIKFGRAYDMVWMEKFV